MIHIQLQQFEGPLALLLYLIRKEEMDIFDININEITKQYLDYIRLMKELNLEVAGEFVAMAATLIHIKSQMLLPQYNENNEEEVHDPRKVLVQKLLEYQKYQEVSKSLYERPLVGRDVWLRGEKERFDEVEEQIVLEENGLFSLIGAYRFVYKRLKKNVHRVGVKVKSIAQRVMEIGQRLIVGQKVALSELVTATGEFRRNELLITFLSTLELCKMGLARVFQSEPLAEIYIEAQKEIDHTSISRVEEYNSEKAEQIASQLIDEAAHDDVIITENPEERLENIQAATDEEIFAAENELAKNEIIRDEQPIGEQHDGFEPVLA